MKEKRNIPNIMLESQNYIYDKGKPLLMINNDREEEKRR